MNRFTLKRAAVAVLLTFCLLGSTAQAQFVETPTILSEGATTGLSGVRLSSPTLEPLSGTLPMQNLLVRDPEVDLVAPLGAGGPSFGVTDLNGIQLNRDVLSSAPVPEISTTIFTLPADGSESGITPLIAAGSADSLADKTIDFSLPLPLLGTGAFFSHIDENGLTPISQPIAGATLRVLVETPDVTPAFVSGEILGIMPNGELDDPQNITAWVDIEASVWGLQNAIVLAFTLPDTIALGPKLVRFRIGLYQSVWSFIEVADPSLLGLREDLALDVLAYLMESGDFDVTPVIVAPYQPLPLGATVRNGLTDEQTHTIASTNSWLFYAFDPREGIEQPGGVWLVIDAKTGDIEAARDGDGWPIVETPDNGGFWFDAGAPGILYQQAFETKVLPRSNNWGLHEPPTTIAPLRPKGNGAWQADGTPFTGLIPRLACPDGIRKVGIILQLDNSSVKVKCPKEKPCDKQCPGGANCIGGSVDAFTQKAAQMKALFQAAGFHEIYHITPDMLVSGRVPGYRLGSYDHQAGRWRPFRDGRYRDLKGLDLDPFLNLLFQIGHGSKCCMEVAIAVLSHGTKTKPESSQLPTGRIAREHLPEHQRNPHYLKYSYWKGATHVAEDAVASADLVEMIVETFRSAGASCTPISIILNACYSGLGVSNADTYLDGTEFGAPQVQVIGSSSKSQKTRAKPTGDGGAHYYFIEALNACLKEQKGRPEPKGLSDEAVWECIKKKVKEATQADGLEQTPKRRTP